MTNDKMWLTLAEVADRLRLKPKAASRLLIGGKQVVYMRVGMRILISRASFLDWEERHQTHVVRR